MITCPSNKSAYIHPRCGPGRCDHPFETRSRCFHAILLKITAAGSPRAAWSAGGQERGAKRGLTVASRLARPLHSGAGVTSPSGQDPSMRLPQDNRDLSRMTTARFHRKPVLTSARFSLTAGSLAGCRRFVQDAKLNFEALFGIAL